MLENFSLQATAVDRCGTHMGIWLSNINHMKVIKLLFSIGLDQQKSDLQDAVPVLSKQMQCESWFSAIEFSDNLRFRDYFSKEMKSKYLVTLCDLVTVFAQTKSVTALYSVPS